jgi:5-hydroxyisourate hydrolase-like protein (transthyretin family)
MVPTDTDGRFRLPSVQEGDYEVTIGHSDYYGDSDNGLLHVGPSAEPWIGVLKRGLDIGGWVFQEDGKPLEDATIVLARLDENGKRIEGFGRLFRTLRTSNEGRFDAHGLISARYQAKFAADGGFRIHTETVDTASPPQPWKVILQKRSSADAEPSGVIWLHIVSDQDRNLEGRARIDLVDTNEHSHIHSIRERLEGSQLHQSGMPLGVFHIVAAVEGYAPAVLPFVRLESAPSEPTLVRIVQGAVAAIEVNGTAKPASLYVREARFGLKVAQEVLQPAPKPYRVNFRLQPGSYAASLTSEDSPASEGQFTLASSADSGNVKLRFEGSLGH